MGDELAQKIEQLREEVSALSEEKVYFSETSSEKKPASLTKLAERKITKRARVGHLLAGGASALSYHVVASTTSLPKGVIPTLLSFAAGAAWFDLESSDR